MWALLHRIIIAHLLLSPAPSVDCRLCGGKTVHHPPRCILAPRREPLHRRDSTFPQKSTKQQLCTTCSALKLEPRDHLSSQSSLFWVSRLLTQTLGDPECGSVMSEGWKVLRKVQKMELKVTCSDYPSWGGGHRCQHSLGAHMPPRRPTESTVTPPPAALPQPHLGSTYLWSEKTKC